MIDLPTYNENNWNFISRGTGSTTPTISDEGILQLGRYTYHTYNTQLDTNKEYKIYLYAETIPSLLYVGIANAEGTPISNIQASSEHGANSGINKAIMKHDGTRWTIRYNEGTIYNLSVTSSAVYLLFNVSTTSNVNYRILAITEEDKK